MQISNRTLATVHHSLLLYDDLSLPALVRGETFIINNIEPPKFSKLRANHLMQLMYFSEQFSFGNVLKYHHDILKDIELGRASWNSNFDSIRARRLIDRVPRQFCSSYNRSVCKKKEGHFNCYGITEEHICSNCWLKRKTVAYHPQKIVEFQEIIHGKETRRQRIRLPPIQVVRSQTLTFDKHVFCIAQTGQKMMAYVGHYLRDKENQNLS